MRALPVAVTLMDQARAWKHDTDLGNRLTDPAFGLIGRSPITWSAVRMPRTRPGSATAGGS